MRLVVDSHTHTIASPDGFSTVNEMAVAARDAGLEALAITDHAPELVGYTPMLHFLGYGKLPHELCGVHMLYGVELNIMDFNGRLDLSDDVLARQDVVIASFHTMCTSAGSVEENTRAYLHAMENPYVNIIGHPDDGYIPIDFERLVSAAKEAGVLIEVNNSSVKSVPYRLNTAKNIRTILSLCKEHRVPIVVGTDAHHTSAVGDFSYALQALEDTAFPEELVANVSIERYEHLLAGRHPYTCAEA